MEYELHLGEMTDEEIAEWCGKSLESFKKNRSRWMKTQFSKYADFIPVKRGCVKITKIHEPIYNSSGKKEVYKKFATYWGNGVDKIDTNVNCWRKMKPNMISKISDDTGQSYVGQTKREDYGVAFGRTKREGKKGHCQFVFCKIIDGEGYLFSDEELEIKKRLEKEHLCSHANQIYQYQALLASLQNGEITLEEYTEAVQKVSEYDNNWVNFKEAFEKELDCLTGFKTMLIDDAIKQQEIPHIEFDF